MAQMINPMSGQYEEYLKDESRYSGYADSISFPQSQQEAAEILQELSKKKIPVTIQGSRTGIVGGAVPLGGHILNLSCMNSVLDFWEEADGTGRIKVQPGITLIDLRKEIGSRFRKNPQFWPPDPTETSASIGGIAASGAQGTTRMLYGKSGQYIESVRILDYEGRPGSICRREGAAVSESGQADVLDPVLGKEGITGVITELTLKLLSKPEAVWGIAFFFPEDAGAARFADELKQNLPKNEGASVAAAEYIGRESLAMIETAKPLMSRIKDLPDISAETAALIYTEIHGTEDGIAQIAEALMETAADCGSDPAKAWAVSEEAEVERLRAFRHAAAETANLFIAERSREDERIRKLGMDMLCTGMFGQTLERFENELASAGLKGCIFGHALENHLHVNLLPDSYEEYCRGTDLMREWALRIGREQGRLIGEHGIGKLKKEILGGLLPREYILQCRKAKELFDPEGMLNPGNIWDAS